MLHTVQVRLPPSNFNFRPQLRSGEPHKVYTISTMNQHATRKRIDYTQRGRQMELSSSSAAIISQTRGSLSTSNSNSIDPNQPQLINRVRLECQQHRDQHELEKVEFMFKIPTDFTRRRQRTYCVVTCVSDSPLLKRGGVDH